MFFGLLCQLDWIEFPWPHNENAFLVFHFFTDQIKIKFNPNQKVEMDFHVSAKTRYQAHVNIEVRVWLLIVFQIFVLRYLAFVTIKNAHTNDETLNSDWKNVKSNLLFIGLNTHRTISFWGVQIWFGQKKIKSPKTSLVVNQNPIWELIRLGVASSRWFNAPGSSWHYSHRWPRSRRSNVCTSTRGHRDNSRAQAYWP